MKRSTLNNLQKMSSDPSVSVLMPTHRKLPDIPEDQIRLKNLLAEAEERLLARLPKRDAWELIEALKSVASGIDLHKLKEGLAIFVSREYQGAFLLPFAVKQRVVIGDDFATRDLVRALNRQPNYGLLMLTGEVARFFLGHEERLDELQESGFPVKFVEDEPADERVTSGTLSRLGWYPPQTRGPSGNAPLPGAYPPDESSHSQRQQADFFRRIDAANQNILREHQVPVIVAGVQEQLAMFESVGETGKTALGTLVGSYENISTTELGNRAWEVVRAELRKRAQAEVQFFREIIGQRKSICGIEEIWKQCRQFPVETLLVEREFIYPARVDAATQAVEKAGDHGPDTVDDLVDEVIEEVVDKGGRVVFTEPDALSQYDRIVAILRY